MNPSTAPGPRPSTAHAYGSAAPPGPPLAWATWRASLWLTLGITLARALYLVWLCPYELAADEAQYWDWARHPALSYYSKGPGVAWVIAASTALFGEAEWAIRLPAVLSTGIAMLAMARLAASMAGGDQRVGFFAAAAFALVPVYHATAILMTIDAPYIACWVCAAWAAWTIARRAGSRRPTTWAWIALAAAMGVGFLFKYTILLLAPGLILWWLTERPAAKTGARTLINALVALAVFGAIISPVVIWNQAHGWPTFSHLLGHLGVRGGDVALRAARPWSYNPLWTLSYFGAQAGLVGPMAAVIVLSVVRARRERLARPESWTAARAALCWGAPILAFYLLVTLFTDVEGNWPIAGYTTLLIPAARLAVSELPRHRRLVNAWKADPTRPRPWAGFLRRRPETPFQLAWDWSVGYGVIGALSVLSATLLAKAPFVGELVPLHKVAGHRAFALEIDSAVRQARERLGAEPFIVADLYHRTSVLAYYLPGRPSVRCAGALMGERRSSYDYFSYTDMNDPSLRGRPVILVGSSPARWSAALRLDGIHEIIPAHEHTPGVYLGLVYAGPATPSPAAPP